MPLNSLRSAASGTLLAPGKRPGTRPVIRLVILATILACAVLAGCSAWFIWTTRENQIHQAEVASSNVARMVGVQVESAMKTATLALADIAERVEHDGDDPVARRRLAVHLGDLADSFSELHGLFVYGPDGAWLATSLGREVAGNNADREYFQHHRMHPGPDVYIGKPVKSRSTGVWIMPISRGIYDRDGTFRGVALVTLQVNFFERIYDELNIGENGTVVLMLSDGTVVYRRPFDDKLIGTDLSKGNIYAELRKRSVGSAFLLAKVDGLVRLYSFRRLSEVPFLVAVGRTKHDILFNWQRSAMLITGAATLISLMFIAFGVKLVRQMAIRDGLDKQLRSYSEELEKHNVGLRLIAHTDKLTQLANRRRFDEMLDQELRRCNRTGTPLSLLLMDLDYFKQFNDTYGHLAGDECLQRTAQALAAQIARAGDLAARYGGEEFAIIMPNTDGAGAAAVAERVRAGVQALRIPHQHSPTQTVTASFGVATLAPDGERAYTVADLIDRADKHLYIAKRTGRNRVCAGEDEHSTL